MSLPRRTVWTRRIWAPKQGIVTASVRCEALAVTGNVERALALGRQVLTATTNVRLTDRAVREIRGRFLLLLLLSAKFREASAYLDEAYDGGEPPDPARRDVRDRARRH